MTPLFLSIIGTSLLVAIVRSHVKMERALARRAGTPSEPPVYPSVTVIRPIKGLDVGLEANLQAALDTDYPGEVETLFVFDDKNDPAYPLVVRAVEMRRSQGTRDRIEILFSGPPPEERTGKLNAMIFAADRARGELIAFCDSDTRPSRTLLRALVNGLLSRPDIGDAFAPALVAGQPRAAGDVGYAMLINSWYGSSVALAAQPAGELDFIMGQFMIFRREALTAIGTLRRAEGQLVDDIFIGACIKKAGYKNLLITDPLNIATGGMDTRSFLKLFRRWLLFSQGLPMQFTRPNWIRGIEVYLAGITTLVALCLASWGWAIIPAIAFALSLASQVRLQEKFGGAPIPLRYLWVPLLVLVVAPILTVASLINRRVDWRGRSYSLDVQAKLAHSDAHAHGKIDSEDVEVKLAHS